MSKIFLSYRREDSADVTGRIDDRLVQQFGREAVFVDVDSIPFGVDFRKHLDEQVGKCDVFLAVIGPDWMGSKDNEGKSRLEDSRDFVRIEVESALKREIPIIPVLVRGATIPDSGRMPVSVQELSYRHGLEVRSGTDFHRDMDRLIEQLRVQLEEQREQAPLPDAHRKTTDVRARTEEARSEVEPPRQKRIDATVPSSKADSPPRLVEPIAEEPATSTLPARATTDQSQSYLSGAIGVIVLIGAVAAFLILQPTQAPIEPMKYQPPPVVEKKVEPPAQVIPPPALPRPAESAVVPKKQEKPVEKQVIANKFAKDIESKKERKAREISSAPSRPIEPVVVPGEQPSPVEEQVAARQPSIPTPEMIRISPGSFRMGGSGKLETPIHTVQFTKPFAIARYETTFDEYDRFARSTGRLWPKDVGWGRESRPVIKVSWDDAKAYVQWLSQQTGHRYRLPTEAEWEYAARSGGKDETWAGTSDESQLKNYAVYDVGRTEPVGSKKPNELNLFDMSGNVREWVEDCEHDYNSAPTDGSAWLERNGGNCHLRVHRGGGWSDRPERLHVSTRDWDSPGHLYSNIGFRLAQDLP